MRDLRRPPGRRRIVAIAFLAAALAAGALAAEDTVTLNFVNADIDAVVKAIGEITGRNFIVDPKVKGQINIISSQPVPKSLVYPTLLSALRLQGFTAVEADGIVKIVPEVDAKQQGGPVAIGALAAGGDRLVTQVVTLRYESASQVVNVLRPLITTNNTIAAFPGNNSLVMTDYAENLKRIGRIIEALDQPPGAEPVIIAVKHASALDLASTLNRVLADAGAQAPGVPPDAQQRVAIVADPRSNSLILRSENPGRVARVRQLIEQLDTPGRAGGNIFIVYLKNAEAARVAQTLRALLTGSDTSASGSSSPSPTPGAPAGAMASSSATTSAGGGGGFSGGGATIQADTANNALIIAAPEPVYNNLRAVIDKLDIRRAQVFIEALIAEVTADKAAEFGIQWQFLTGYNRTGNQAVGGTNFGARGTGNNIIDVSGNLGSAAQGLNLGIINGTITIPGLGSITNLAFLARALEKQANANILSTPTLLTLDNEEAKIVVGQNVPFITGQYTNTGAAGTAVTPFQTIERKDVGLTLRVKPQITEGGSVKVVIYQEVSRVSDTTNPAGIITNKRSLESSVVVDDDQIVVLGGLMQDDFEDGTQKVPLVGDIPVVGALFRYDTRQRTKTNLLVFLKPTVVRSASTASGITQGRYEMLMGEQQRLAPGERFFWNDPTFPTLAPPGSAGAPAKSAPPAAAPAPKAP